ncbi:hypothetical protein MTP03_17830 [Tsukamurella sp. PLM1]|nr:hypothetical protein MTP03_17830 [Tsukamurella sp. PLM1]
MSAEANSDSDGADQSLCQMTAPVSGSTLDSSFSAQTSCTSTTEARTEDSPARSQATPPSAARYAVVRFSHRRRRPR